MLLRRNRTFLVSDNSLSFVPIRSTSPVVAERIPDSIEISVVLPQPEGPTIIVSSPNLICAFMSCNTLTSWSPTGKSLLMFDRVTAASTIYPLNTIAGSSLKTFLRLKTIENRMTIKMTANVPAITCQRNIKPCRAGTSFVISKNNAVKPIPIE